MLFFPLFLSLSTSSPRKERLRRDIGPPFFSPSPSLYPFLLFFIVLLCKRIARNEGI